MRIASAREHARGLVDHKAKADMLRIADEADAIAEALENAGRSNRHR